MYSIKGRTNKRVKEEIGTSITVSCLTQIYDHERSGRPIRMKDTDKTVSGNENFIEKNTVVKVLVSGQESVDELFIYLSMFEFYRPEC